jgi:hypothetical protein
MQSNCRLQVFELLAESIGQTRETTHAHSHRQVLAFNQAIDDSGSAGKLGHRKKVHFARQNLPGALISCRARSFCNLQNASFSNWLAGVQSWHAACDRSSDGVRSISARELDGDVAWVFLMH